MTENTPMSKNILCLDQFSNLGGGQRSLLDLLPAISDRGWRVSVASPGHGPFTELLAKLGYRTHSFTSGSYAIKKKTLFQHLKYAFEIPGLIDFFTESVKAHDIHLLYVNGPRMVPAAAWISWKAGIPMVFHSHNRLLQRSAVALTGWALELASAQVIACCHYAAEPLREYVLPENLRIVYNGIAEIASHPRQSDRTIRRIGVVGRIEQEKGQLKFVEAAWQVSQKVSGCQFKIVGSPMFSTTEYYEDVLVSSAGLPIDFVDWRDNPADIYSDLDLLVVPSSPAEATTRVIIEAYAAGVPVIAFPVGGIPEILQDNQTGFLTRADTVSALADRMLSVLRMDGRVVSGVVERARQEWHRRFTLAVYRDTVCDVLAQAMQPTAAEAYSELPESDEPLAHAEALTD